MENNSIRPRELETVDRKGREISEGRKDADKEDE